MKVPSPTNLRVVPSSQPLVGPSGAGATPEAFGAQLGKAGQQFALAARDQAIGYQRTDALRQLSDFTIEENRLFTEAQRAAQNSPLGFADTYMEGYRQRQEAFLAALPGEVREEVALRTDSLGVSLAEESLRYQFTQTDNATKQNLTDLTNSSMTELSQGGSLEDLEHERAKIDEAIEASGLPEAEKVAVRRAAYSNLEAVTYKQEQLRRLQSEATGERPREMAADLMEIVSGRSPDEIGQATYEGEAAAISGVGVDQWAALPARVRASLIAVAADYGQLPESVANAAASGNLEAIAQAVAELPTPGADTLADNVLNPGAGIDDNPAFAMVPYEDRLAMRADAERETAAAINAAQAQTKAENAAKVNALHVALLDGNAGRMAIDQAREEGWLSDVQDIEKANKLLADQTKGIADAQRAIQMLYTNQTFDPMSDDDKKALNAYLNLEDANGRSGLDALQDHDDEFVSNQLVPLVAQAQDIPTDAAGLLIGMMRSRDIASAQWALDTLAQLRQASPAAFDHRLSEPDAAMVEFWDTRKDFYTPEQLTNMVRGGLTPEDRRTNDLLRKEAQTFFVGDKAKNYNLEGQALAAFNANSSSLPGTTKQGMMQDFHTLFEDEYVRSYGDANAATQSALSRLKKYWSNSTIGGKPHVMRNSPELNYRPMGGSYQWIEDQALQDLGMKIRPNLGPLNAVTNIMTGGQLGAAQDAAFAADLRKEIKSFQLISDPQTQAEVDGSKQGGPAPSYLIMVTNMDGTTELLMNEVDQRGNSRMMPRRIFFEVTPEMKAAQDAEWERRRAQMLGDDQVRSLDGAIKFADETGHPIPQDLTEGFIQLQDLVNQEP